MGATSKWLFVSGLPSGSPEIPIVGTLVTLRAHNFACRPLIAMRSKEKLKHGQELFNGMLHDACMRRNQVGS